MRLGRVVLDTNVVVPALLFTSGRLAWVRHAWQREQSTPCVCPGTVAELMLAIGRVGAAAILTPEAFASWR